MASIPPPPPLSSSVSSANQKTQSGSSGQSGEYWKLPVAFYFKVVIQGEINIGEIAFKEVSGLNFELETESLDEGGVNNFCHQLPKRIKHGNLVMKRAIVPVDKLNEAVLNRWLKSVFSGEYANAVQTETILVQLLDEKGTVLHQWTCENAYPVKCEIESFDSEKNGIAIESLEFAYSSIKRDK